MVKKATKSAKVKTPNKAAKPVKAKAAGTAKAKPAKAKSAKPKPTGPAKSAIAKPTAARKANGTPINELRSAAKASAARRLAK